MKIKRTGPCGGSSPSYGGEPCVLCSSHRGAHETADGREFFAAFWDLREDVRAVWLAAARVERGEPRK